MRKWISCVAATLLIFGAGCGKKDKDAKGEKGEVKGKGGEKLALTAPGDVSVKQGDKKKIAVEIERTKFEGPVELTFSQLPDGVKIEESGRTIAKDETKATFTLVANAKADPKKGHKAKVSAKSGDLQIGPFEFGVDVIESK